MRFNLAADQLTGPVANVCLPAAELPSPLFMVELRAEDFCENVVITDPLSPVILSGEGSGGGTNNLLWTPLITGTPSTTITYQLERNGLDSLATIIFEGDATEFADRLEATNANLGLACYRVLTTVTTPDGFTNTYASNTLCLEQQLEVYLPNVFSPVANQPENRSFCPGFARPPSGEGYQLDVWDRWGGHVFTTNDPTECWTGEDGDQAAASGVYLVVLQFSSGGQSLRVTEELLLIR